MKEMHLESGPERMNRVCLLDAPGQGIPLGRGDISEGSLAMSLCVTVLGLRNGKKWFARRSKRTRWNVRRSEFREIKSGGFRGRNDK